MKNYLSIDETKEMFCHVAQVMVDSEEELAHLDRQIGDGDHGRNMCAGFREVLHDLPKMQYTCVEDVFLAVGTILLDVCGGASGVLFGTFFISGVVKHKKNFTARLNDFAEIYRVALDAMITRGKAQPGDKTMIDAIDPVVRSFEESAEQGVTLLEGFERAAQAAKDGAEATKGMVARHGRARYFKERGIGIQDPGATSIALIFGAMADWARMQKWTEYINPSEVLTLTLNPCQDKTIDIEAMVHGGTNRIISVQNDVSGKGINVSCVLQAFDVPTRCLGFNFSEDAKILERFLNNHHIPFDFVTVPGVLRTNMKVFEQSSRTMTEFNEAGQPVPKVAVEQLEKMILRHTPKNGILTLSGSMPKGVPTNIYRRIIEQVNLTGCKTILDASGQALIEGIKALPYMIKPNIDEFRDAFRERLDRGESIEEIAGSLIESGIHYICLSVGSKGAYLITQDKILFAPPLHVDVKGVQGAGDSVVAGMCLALRENRCDEEILAYGIAAAAGSLEHSGTQLCTEEDFRRILPSVTVVQVKKIEV